MKTPGLYRNNIRRTNGHVRKMIVAERIGNCAFRDACWPGDRRVYSSDAVSRSVRDPPADLYVRRGRTKNLYRSVGVLRLKHIGVRIHYLTENRRVTEGDRGLACGSGR